MTDLKRRLTGMAWAVPLAALSCTGECTCGSTEEETPLVAEEFDKYVTMDRATLEDRLWPKPRAPAYRASDEARFEATKALFRTIAEDETSMDLLQGLAHEAGLDLEQWQVGDQSYLALVELSATRGMMGAYLIRRGPPQPVEIVIQAPHSFYDVGSGQIALDVFLKAGSRVRGLFVNSLHRYRQADGTKESRDENPADVAHNSGHPFNGATEAFAAAYDGIIVLQLHGFSRTREIHGSPRASVVASAGKAEQSSGLIARLEAELERRLDIDVAKYPEDTDSLGATTNVQGQMLARFSTAQFAHLELSDDLRDRLRADERLLDAFAAAVVASTSPRPAPTP